MQENLKQFIVAGVLMAASAASAIASERTVQPVQADAVQAEEAKSEQPKVAPVTPETKTDKAASSEVQDTARARKPPRRPDTAGWRRIMAGAGRT